MSMGDSVVEQGEAARVPGRLETYALAYASGLIWLGVAAVLLGGQKEFAFDGVYDTLLAFPPLAAAATILLVDHRGSWKTYPLRVLLLAVVGAVVSAASTVILAPLLVLMFRGGVTGDLGVTGMIASVVLAVMASPLLYGLRKALADQAVGRLVVLTMGMFMAFIALAMTLDPTGGLASSMRLDQARIIMVVSAWWLPVYSGSAAVLREMQLA